MMIIKLMQKRSQVKDFQNKKLV